MSKTAKRNTLWFLLGTLGILVLAACGSIVQGIGETAPVVDTSVPTATRAPDPTVTKTIEVEQPTLEPADTAEAVEPTLEPAETNETGQESVDDRPAWLKRVTSDWNTNWAKHSVPYDEILAGGPPRDGIPSIDNPKFVSSEEAADWLEDNEPVISLEIDGEVRAYPLQILTWHEIVNDKIGDVPVLVTFCPLCNSALVFDRRLGGEVYEFGTSGMLRNSDLIMYDRTQESLWQQLTGDAIVGDLLGERLTFLPASLVSFANFQGAYPDGQVLSRDTGFRRSYGQNPYSGYDRIGQSPFLFDGEEDDRLAAMARVITVEVIDPSGEPVYVAYPLSVLAAEGVINDIQGGVDLVVLFATGTSSALDTSRIAEGVDVGATGVFEAVLDGQKLSFDYGEDGIITDQETGSTWNVLGQATAGPLAGQSLVPIIHGDHFWFAWAAFRPDTIVYEVQ